LQTKSFGNNSPKAGFNPMNRNVSTNRSVAPAPRQNFMQSITRTPSLESNRGVAQSANQNRQQKPGQRNPAQHSQQTRKPMNFRGGHVKMPTARPTHGPKPLPRAKENIPEIADNVIRIIPLGGVEEIGRNMTAIETKDDIIVIDAGFQFKDDSTPGIDYIIPNTQYLEDRQSKIRGILITHAHLDHIGGIPYVMPRIGNPPMYTRNLTSLMILKRQAEFPHLAPLNIKIVEKNDTIILGNTKIKLFGVTHTIPDSMGIAIENSIHYIDRFKLEFKTNKNYIKTIRICHNTVGQSIIIASLTIIFGFSILILSNFIPSVYFGILIGLSILSALIFVLTLMPQLILILKPFKNG
jgi:hypothetical protein